jgi:hypothetical protein
MELTSTNEPFGLASPDHRLTAESGSRFRATTRPFGGDVCFTFRSFRSSPEAGISTVRFSGGHGGGAIPDPIPNSEVKPSSANGTAGATLWESRTPPDLCPGHASVRGSFLTPVGGRALCHARPRSASADEVDARPRRVGRAGWSRTDVVAPRGGLSASLGIPHSMPHRASALIGSRPGSEFWEGAIQRCWRFILRTRSLVYATSPAG